MQVKFDILGKEKVIGILSAIKTRVRNLSPAYRNIAATFREMEKLNFDAGGYPTGWRPLSPKYAAWKAKHYPGKPIMVLTGDLRKSLTSKGGDHIEVIMPQVLEMGTKDSKAAYHQYGTRKMYQRKLISPTPADMRTWTNIIRDFIIDKLGMTRD